jgi:UDP-glucuronate decarboxylase
MATVLITGGAGFIGSCLADRLLQDESMHVVLVDNLSTGKKYYANPSPRCTFITADANSTVDMAAIFGRFQFDYVFHYAAVVGVQRTLANPALVLKDIDGFRNVLDLSKNTGVKRVFFSSSSEVYGESVEYPQNEVTTPLNSRLPYAIVKNVGEAYFQSYQTEFDLDFTIFRFFNTYGARQSDDFVVARFVHAALKDEDITVYGAGDQTRTFCYIQDNVDACYNALAQDQFVNDVVNVGSEKETTILELAQIVIKLCDSKSSIVHLPELPEGDMKRRLPDASRMKTLLGRQHTSLDEGLKCVIASALSHHSEVR